MKRVLKIFRVFLIIGVLLIGIGAGLAYFFQDEIVAKATGMLNGYLKTPVNVESIEFSVLRKFPKASIIFNEVNASGVEVSGAPDTLFSFDRLYLSFDLYDLYNGKYTLKNIEADGGVMHLYSRSSGDVNYVFWETADSASGEFALDLERIDLKNTQLIWDEPDAGRFISVDVSGLRAKGSFTSSEIAFALFGDVRVNEVSNDQKVLASDLQLQPDVGIEYLNESKTVQISRGLLRVRDQLDFEVTGSWGSDRYESSYKTVKADLSDFVALMPAFVRAQLDSYDIDGVGTMEISMNKSEDQATGALSGVFSIEKGKFEEKESGLKLEGLFGKGTITQSRLNNPSSLTILMDTLTGEFGAGRFNWTGEYRQQNTFVKGKFEASGNPGEFPGIGDLDTLSALSGHVRVKTVLEGSLSSEGSSGFDPNRLVRSGIAEFEEVALAIENSPISINTLSGSVLFTDGRIVFDSCSGFYRNTPVLFTGFSNNLTSFVIGESPVLNLEGDLKAGDVSWKDLIGEEAGPEEAPESFIPNNLNLKLSFGIESFTKDELRIANAVGRLRLSSGELELSPVRLEALNGSLRGVVSVKDVDQGLVIESKLKAEEFNIKETLTTFNNFGQTEVTSEHLSGILTADVFSRVTTDYSFTPDTDELFVNADLIVENGRLVNYEPVAGLVEDLESDNFFMRAVNLDAFEASLKDIRFERLENTLRIEDGRLYIPGMEIRSSAMNVGIEGSHSFKNEISYKVYFNLKEVLLKKPPKEEEFGYVVDDGTGDFMVFREISGTVDNPIIKRDKEASKAYNKEIKTQEWKTTKTILKEEIGLFKNDTSLNEVDRAVREIEYELDLGEFGEPSSESSPSKQKTSSNPEKGKEEKKGVKKWLKKLTEEDSTKQEVEWEFDEDDQ